MGKITDATTMTAETNNTRLTLSRRGPPAYRKPNQTRAARQRKEMIAELVAELGGNVSPVVMRNITRAVDLDTLASKARAALAAGNATIDDVVRLAGAADRAMRRLSLSPPNAAAAVPLADYLAGRGEEG